MPQHFLKTHFCIESGFLLFLELHKSLLISFQECWAQWQRFKSSSIDHFWDTPQHFHKRQFCLESGFLSFLELQNSLLISFQGCWTQWQRFESSSIHCFSEILLQHFLKTYFCIDSGFLSVPRVPEIPTQYIFQECWAQWQRFKSFQHSLFLRHPTAFSQNTISAEKVASFHS